MTMINMRFWRRMTWSDSVKIDVRLTRMLSEFFGTFILIFVGCMGCVFHNPITARHHLEGAFAFAFAVTTAIQCFAHVSGSHINPMLSIAGCICGQISVLAVPFYIVSQCAGALAGYGMVALLAPYYDRFGMLEGSVVEDSGVCATDISPHLELWQGFFIEAGISGVTALVFCAAIDSRNKIIEESLPLRFGLAIGTLGLIAAPFSSSHMNPARTLGPMVVNGYHKNHWVCILKSRTSGKSEGTLCVLNLIFVALLGCTYIGKFVKVKSEISWLDKLSLAFAEYCGTVIFVSIGCMGSTFERSHELEMESPFALGMGVMIAMQIFGRISGGHVNPMISITSVLIGQLSVIDALCYIVAQFTGAFAAQIMLLLLLPNLYVYGTPNPRDGDYKFCSPRISAEMSGGKALGLEGVITFLLTMSFCGMWDLRNEKWIDSRPLRLGVIISGLTIAAWPFTGGFLNPARTLAAAAVNNFWEYCHMYLIGQLLGGVLGALTYIIFFIQLEPSQDVTAPPAEEEKA